MSDFIIQNGKLLQYVGTGTRAEIPETVKSIEKEAFAKCGRLKEIIIPNTVTEIGERAFYACGNLKSITIPGSVKNLGPRIFSGVPIEEVVLEYGVPYVAERMFSDCKKLKKITFANSIKEIGLCAFWGCESLETVKLPPKIESIGAHAFRDCKSLKKIEIPKETKVGWLSFDGCNSLTIYAEDKKITKNWHKEWSGKSVVRVVWGSVIEKQKIEDLSAAETQELYNGFETDFVIQNGVLKEYLGIEGKVVVPSGVKVIAETAFFGSEKIESVVLPDSVERIDANAFSRCGRMKTITLGKGVQEIQANAFGQCVQLESIFLHNKISVVGKNVFKGCEKLTVYAEAEKKPDGWWEKKGFLGFGIKESWNPDNRPVVWGYKEIK